MKILVIQLARLGDIYLTWPALRALKRCYPQSEIHLMVRDRFKEAVHGLNAVDKLVLLNTKEILNSLFQPIPDVEIAHEELKSFIRQLKNENYDQVINLTYSGFSSYLTHALSTQTSLVRGYSRHSDGFFHIPDDISSYFYAQVGIQRDNRLHLADLFAQTLDVDLIPEDWYFEKETLKTIDSHCSQKYNYLQNYLIVHIGASQKHKTYSPHKWHGVLKGITSEYNGQIVLVGSQDEKPMAETITMGLNEKLIINLVGQTSLLEIFDLVSRAQLLIGCDSAPIHIASLTKTPVLNISFSTVNFWETGPRSLGSRVLLVDKEEDLASDRVVVEAMNILNGKSTSENVYETQQAIPSYIKRNDTESFRWNLIQALYIGKDFPVSHNPAFFEGLTRLREMNEVFLEQYRALEESKQYSIESFVNRGEEVILAISRLVPDTAPLIRWYQTEKIRIPPLDFNELKSKTINIHQNLETIISLYLGPISDKNIFSER